MKPAPALAAAFLMVLPLIANPARAQTQTPNPSGTTEIQDIDDDDLSIERQAAFLHFATHYTETMVVGFMTGGLAFNWLVGGLPATMLGSFTGAVVASWLYFDKASESYTVRPVR
jgi:hypothetical protein